MCKFITAVFLDARRASFVRRYARGILPIRRRAFIAPRSGLNGACPFCGVPETAEHIFFDCLMPSAPLNRLRDLYQLPGIPYPTVRFLNPLPSGGRRQFVLAITEISYQVWLARCRAAYSSKTPNLQELKNKVKKELWFRLDRKRRFLGGAKFLEQWGRPRIISEEKARGVEIKY